MTELWYQSHIERNPFSRPGIPLQSVSAIVWHYTANPGASAENHIRYFGETIANQNPNDDEKDRYASAHIFIDRDSAVEIIPLNEKAIHAGNSWYNLNSIGIELCIEKDGSFHPNTIDRAVKIGALLNKKHRAIKHVRHFDVTGKLCPKLWVESPALWTDFRNKIAAAIKEGPKMKKEDADKIIKLLQAVYQFAPNPEIGRLADELRKASGQAPVN